MIKGSTTTVPPSTSTGKSGANPFLACFGFSRKNKKQSKDIKVNSKSRRHRWFFKWTTFKFKKPAVVKTVPVVKSDTKWEIEVVEEDAKLSKKWTDSVKSQNRSNGSELGSYRSRHKEIKLHSPAKKSVTISQPLVSSPLRPLMHSVSLQSSKGKKLVSVLSAPNLIADRAVTQQVLDKSRKTKREIDSLYGMSIILVILVVMMLWGKLFAIICTSSWFFMAPRLRPVKGRDVVVATEKRSSENNNKLELESMEYKKKVVLEGLLQRNNRIIVGRSTRIL
ncbi:uncharacterized protein [Rutidosis leptorrhynchoides]|uniref:uncharacterized protein n=1 Tax=Rutidosis leptorrhynchoides TaxID=125765 RepID=UPI003A998D0D